MSTNYYRYIKFRRNYLIVASILLFTSVFYYFNFALVNRLFVFIGHQPLNGSVWIKESMSEREKYVILEVIDSAILRNNEFWSANIALPTIIICSDSTMVKTFNPNGWSNQAVSVFTPTMRYIVVNPDGLTVDILSHEICHHVIYERLLHSNYFKHRQLPVWLDEGLAMQVDNRETFSFSNIEKQQAELNKIVLYNIEDSQGFYEKDRLWYNYAKSKKAVYQLLDSAGLQGVQEIITYGYKKTSPKRLGLRDVSCL